MESPRFELGFSPCHGDVFPLDHDPISCKGSFENRTRSSFLPRTRAPGILTNRLLPVIAEGIEPRAPTRSGGRPACHAGVLAAGPCDRFEQGGRDRSRTCKTPVIQKTQCSRPSRFSGLRTRPYKWRVQESHLAVRAYEAQMSTSPPASCKPRNRTGLPTL